MPDRIEIRSVTRNLQLVCPCRCEVLGGIPDPRPIQQCYNAEERSMALAPAREMSMKVEMVDGKGKADLLMSSIKQLGSTS